MHASRTGVQEWKSYWYLPLVAALGYATSTLYVYAMGPFFEPVQQAYGWSRAQVASGITIASLLTAVFSIPLGMLVDRVGPRRVGLLGVLLACTAFGMLGFSTGTKANWVLHYCAIAIATVFVQTTVWTSAVNSRFSASRGLALAITLSGASVAVTIFPIIGTWLIENYDWRTAFKGMGLLWACLVFPAMFLGFRGARDGKRYSSEADSGTRPAAGLTLKEGFRSSALYKLVMASSFFCFTAIGIVVHFIPMLKDHGTDPLEAAGIASLIGVFSIIGRLGTGFLLDRFAAHKVGALAFLLPLIACFLMLQDGANPVNQSVAAAIYGLTLGSEVDVIAYLAAKYFGLRNFGALFGVLVMALSLGTAFGPLAAGAIFDHYGNYTNFLYLTVILMGSSALALFSLGSTPTADELEEQPT